MARETSLEIASSLEALLPVDSKAQEILSELQQALRDREPSDDSDYTKFRAQSLRSLALSMRSLIDLASSAKSSYSDKAKTLSVVADSYLKLTHAFKTDPKMWSLAQSELVPILSEVSDESGIDSALVTLNSHLSTYLNSLEFWLEK